MKIKDYIYALRTAVANMLLDHGQLYCDLQIGNYKFADCIFYNICDILTDICNDTKFVYRGQQAALFAAFAAFFDTYGQRVMDMLFADGYSVLRVEREQGVYIRLMARDEYHVQTEKGGLKVSANDGGEVYVMRSPTFSTLGQSDRALLRPYLVYLDNVLNGSNTANERMGVLMAVSPEGTAAGNQPNLSKWEKDEFEKELGGDDSKYGILKKQKSVILFPRPMKFQTISLSAIDNRLSERVKMCILAIADRIKVPANQIAIIDSDNSRSLSNGSELRVGDAQKYKSFRRFLNATFWLFAKDLGLGDIDYTIAGEPQENKIEL